MPFEAFDTKELDRVIVDEQKVTKCASKRRVEGSVVATKKTMNVVEENARSRVKAVMTADGETHVEVIDKEEEELAFSDVDTDELYEEV